MSAGAHRLVRYYITGVVNTAFGYGMFAAMIAAGTPLFAAQLVSHCLGVAFNYVTFSRFAFRSRRASKARFALSYAVNYLISLVLLYAVSHVLTSPYAAGLVTTLTVSMLNYFVLRRLVFHEVRV